MNMGNTRKVYMRYMVKKCGWGLAIDQGIVHGWRVSWNPDDVRYYIERTDGTTKASFARWANAVYYCKTHAAE